MREVGGEGPRTGCESRSKHDRASLFWTSLKELKVGRQCQDIQDDLEVQIDIDLVLQQGSTTRRIGKVCVSDPRLVVKRDSPRLEEISFRLLTLITQSDRCRSGVT